MGVPIPREVIPNFGEPGDRLTVKIIGDVLSEATRCSFGNGILTGVPRVISDGELRVKLEILPDASLGWRDAVVTNTSGDGTLRKGFEVI